MKKIKSVRDRIAAEAAELNQIVTAHRNEMIAAAIRNDGGSK